MRTHRHKCIYSDLSYGFSCQDVKSFLRYNEIKKLDYVNLSCEEICCLTGYNLDAIYKWIAENLKSWTHCTSL